MSGVPSGGNPVKNIIIGVVTTVIAYVIVHYIFDKKSGKEDQEKSKQATESAWNSVNDYITYSNEKFKTIACFSCERIYTPRYSCSLPMFASSCAFGIMSTTLPFSIT